MSHTPTEPAASVCQQPDPHPGIIRLPVAPRVNHRIRFAPLQSKVPSAVQPQAAIRMVEELSAAGSQADSVLICGPGDPLADTELPLATIAMLRKSFPDVQIVLRTLGIGGLQHADKFQQAGVSEAEIMIDGVLPQVLELVYAWIRPGFKTLKLSEAVHILIDEQAKSIQAFKDAGIKVRIITTLYPTVNEDHLPVLARQIADLGADEMILTPYVPPPEADILLPAAERTNLCALAEELSAYLPVREGRSETHTATGFSEASNQLPKPRLGRPNVAVVSSNGMDIDLHLGQAPQLLVYGPRADGLNCLLECRPVPPAGAGSDRWDILAGSIPDCFALLTANAGERPRRILDGHGIQVIITQNEIEGTVDTLYGGGKKGRGKRPVT